MAPIGAILQLLGNLTLSTVDNTVKINKDFLTDIHICLQDVHDTIEFLQLESQLQAAELQPWIRHSEPVSVQKNETDSHK